MNRKQNNRLLLIVMGAVGAILAIWTGLQIAPGRSAGLRGITEALSWGMEHPFAVRWVPESLGTVLAVLLFYFVIFAMAVSAGKGFRKGEEYGSARWGNARLIDRKYRDSSHPFQNMILTRNVAMGNSERELYRHQRTTNVMLIGAAGTGKSRGYVIPNLLQGEISYVVLDPSGEILRATGNFLQNKKGYRIRVLNLVDPDASSRYNPFVYLEDDDDVDQMVENFWKATTQDGAPRGEQIWDDTAKELLAALAYYLFYFAPPREQNFPMIQYMVRNMAITGDGKGTKSPIDKLFDNLEEDHPEHIALKHYRAYHSGATKTLQSIQITLLSRLSKFNLTSIGWLSSTTEDELGLLTAAETKTVIFAVTPVADTSLNFFVSLLYGQMFEILYAYGNEHGKLKVPLHFLMDEFANITLPRDFEKRLATFRKYLISASIVLQDLSQLKAIFEKQWQSIVNNCDELLYLGGNESSTHEYLSKLLGKETIRTNTYGQSKGRNGSWTKNEQQLGRELMTPDEIRLLDNRYSLLLIRGELPIMDLKYDLNRHPNIKYTTYGEGKPYQHKVVKDYSAATAVLVLGLSLEEVKKIKNPPPIEFEWYNPGDAQPITKK